METLNNYYTIKIPLYSKSNTSNSFEIVGNKFIIDQQISKSSMVDHLSTINKINNSDSFAFILPENYSQQLDFESDLTITYKIINNEFHLIKIDAMYSEDYIDMVESNTNIFPILKNGYITFNTDTTANTTNFIDAV